LKELYYKLEDSKVSEILGRISKRELKGPLSPESQLTYDEVSESQKEN